ncbi:MAG: hypothetical protein FJ096_14300, partial [Deltaproteobacteria bacterium]|nr:hypothetical protein [Deltaproteobacteria bacterium]
VGGANGGSGVGGASGVTGSGVTGSGPGSSGSGVTGSGVTGSGPGSSGSGVTTGAGGPMAEDDCLDGVDGDGDGLVDCADADCAPGFTCIPAVPQGWFGPLTLFEGPSQGGAPTCGDGHPILVADAFEGLSADPASCAACSCGSPKGVACNVASFQLFAGDNCMGGGGGLTIAANACIGFVSMTDPRSVRWATAPAAGGVCIGKADAPPMVKPYAWATRMRACGAATLGEGCGNDMCAPRPPQGFAPGTCIAQAGDVPCPDPGYPLRQVYHRNVDDTRTCTDCDCTPPLGMTCSGSMSLGTDGQCSADITTLSTVGQCAPLDPDPTPPPQPSVYQTLRSVVYNSGVSVGGSCSPIPSVAVGAAVPVDPITVCCTP